MNPTKPAAWRSFCPQFNRGLTFQLVLNLGKGHSKDCMTEFLRDTLANLNGIYYVMSMNPSLVGGGSE